MGAFRLPFLFSLGLGIIANFTSLSQQTALAVSFTFRPVDPSLLPIGSNLSSQFALNVTDKNGVDNLEASQVRFSLFNFNLPNSQSQPFSITNIYLDDQDKGSLLRPSSNPISEPSGVLFKFSLQPIQVGFPNIINFDADLAVESLSPVVSNGINVGESLSLFLDLTSGYTLRNVIDLMQQGSLGVSFLAQSLSNNQKLGFVNSQYKGFSSSSSSLSNSSISQSSSSSQSSVTSSMSSNSQSSLTSSGVTSSVNSSNSQSSVASSQVTSSISSNSQSSLTSSEVTSSVNSSNSQSSVASSEITSSISSDSQSSLTSSEVTSSVNSSNSQSSVASSWSFSFSSSIASSESSFSFSNPTPLPTTKASSSVSSTPHEVPESGNLWGILVIGCGIFLHFPLQFKK